MARVNGTAGVAEMRRRCPRARGVSGGAENQGVCSLFHALALAFAVMLCKLLP